MKYKIVFNYFKRIFFEKNIVSFNIYKKYIFQRILYFLYSFIQMKNKIINQQRFIKAFIQYFSRLKNKKFEKIISISFSLLHLQVYTNILIK
jgi:hypothetical protein